MAEADSPFEHMLQKMQSTWPETSIVSTLTVKRLFYAREVFFGAAKQIMEAHALSPGEYDALCSLRIQGPPYELTPSDICQVNMLSSGGLTKVLNNLEARSLVNRRTCPTDQRSRRVQLTEQGQVLIDEILSAVFADYEKRMCTALSRQECQQLDSLLKKINQLSE